MIQIKVGQGLPGVFFGPAWCVPFKATSRSYL